MKLQNQVFYSTPAFYFPLFVFACETQAPSFCTNTCFCSSSRLARGSSVGTLAGPSDPAHDPDARKHEEIDDPVDIEVIPRSLIPRKIREEPAKDIERRNGFRLFRLR